MLKKAGLDVEFFFTEGGGQTLQVITSGSVDVAMSNGLLGTIGAYSKKAPIRVISAQMTGAHELFWYVRAESTIRSLKDATEKNTIAFSSPGSSSNLILLALLNQAGSKARPTATGGLPGTLTSVMTGQIDIGWATPPFALREIQEKKIIIVARAREATELTQPDDPRQHRQRQFAQDQARRDHAADAGLSTRRSSGRITNPRAIDYFAEFAKAPRDIAGTAVKEFFPSEALQIGEIRDLDRTLRDALQYKFTTSQLTQQDVAGLFDILYKPPAK